MPPEENILQNDNISEHSTDVLDDSLPPVQSKEDGNNPPTTKRKLLNTVNIISKKKKDDNTKILEILEKRANEREKIMEQLNISASDDADPTLLFFKSMALTVKTFPPHLIATAKSKIFQVVSELEMSSLQFKQGLTHSTTTAYNTPSGTSVSDTISDVGNYYSQFSPAFIYHDEQT